MKKLIIIAVVAAIGWFVYTKMQQYSTPEQIQSSAPVKYVTNLQQDVKKAETAADAANKKIQRETKDINQAVQDASKP